MIKKGINSNEKMKNSGYYNYGYNKGFLIQAAILVLLIQTQGYYMYGYIRYAFSIILYACQLYYKYVYYCMYALINCGCISLLNTDKFWSVKPTAWQVKAMQIHTWI